MMEQEILALLKEKGPLTGAEISASLGGDGLLLWRTCRLSPAMTTQIVGTRYMRLDRDIDGYARMSPSVFREFLTYSVIGLKSERDSSALKAQQIASRMEAISRAKLDLAYRLASLLVSQVESEWACENGICFIIAGDIVYNMAHDVPRPERSTGKMVNGSDMDIVVIVDDEFPDHLMRHLDDTIYEEKCRLLMSPYIKEEIDYIVKRMERVREQIRFETFKHMVACKILQEGTLLCGSENLFTSIKTLLRESGVTDKIRELQNRAERFRHEAEARLLEENPEKIKSEYAPFFYPTEESDEFE